MGRSISVEVGQTGFSAASAAYAETSLAHLTMKYWMTMNPIDVVIAFPELRLGVGAYNIKTWSRENMSQLISINFVHKWLVFLVLNAKEHAAIDFVHWLHGLYAIGCFVFLGEAYKS